MEPMTNEQFKNFYKDMKTDDLIFSNFESHVLKLDVDGICSTYITINNKKKSENISFYLGDIHSSNALENFLLSLGLINCIPENNIDEQVGSFVSKEKVRAILKSEYDINLTFEYNDSLDNTNDYFLCINGKIYNNNELLTIKYSVLKSIDDEEIRKQLEKFDYKLLEKILLKRKIQIKKAEQMLKEKNNEFKNKISSLSNEEKIYLQLRGVL